MAHSLSPVPLSGSPPCGLRPPAALPPCPARPQPSLETGACGYWSGPSSVPSKTYLHPTPPVNVALFGTGVLAGVIQLRPWIQSGPQIQARVWDGEVWKGAACQGGGTEVTNGGHVCSPGGHQGGGAARREGRGGMTSPLGASRRASLLAPAFQTSGLRNAERLGFSCFQPQYVVLCRGFRETGTGATAVLRMRLQSPVSTCPPQAGPAPYPLPGQHPLPTGGTCLLPSAPSPLQTLCSVLCQMNTQGLKPTGSKGPGGPLCPASCPGADAQPGRPAGEQNAGPGVAETHGLYWGLL